MGARATKSFEMAARIYEQLVVKHCGSDEPEQTFERLGNMAVDAADVFFENHYSDYYYDTKQEL
ncbi:MAG TPA: hypothetical protein VFR73_15030 [Hyphomicrobiaceae bacterium]|nr:hypothetical protein [Hyphomicrobiaceae bacterium]